MRAKKLAIQIYESVNKKLSYARIKYGLFPSLKIMSTRETKDYIMNNSCSIARFGDGEFDLIFRTADEGYQVRSEELSKALKEVFNNSNENLLICIPGYVNSVKDAKSNVADFWMWYLWIGNKRAKIINLIESTVGKDYCFGDTQITRPFDYSDRSYADSFFSNIKDIWKDKDIIIIEGEQTRMGVGNDLFDNIRSVKRILAPAVNAFEFRNTIKEETIRMYNGELILLALGPTATILASDFSKKGIRALDLGHIDIEYEWYLRNADRKVSVPGKWVNESDDGKVYTNCTDEEYNRQIVMRIGC